MLWRRHEVVVVLEVGSRQIFLRQLPEIVYTEFKLSRVHET